MKSVKKNKAANSTSQAKISVIIACKQKRGRKIKYLLYRKLKSPLYGYQGFPTGKVKKGENILVAAKRQLKEETGLNGTPELFAVRHYKIFDKNKNLLEDKIFFACRFVNPKGKLLSTLEGNCEWVDKDKVWDYLNKPAKQIKEILERINDTRLTFVEKEYSISSF